MQRQLSTLRLLASTSSRFYSSDIASPSFAHAKTGTFVQDPPRHENPYLGDVFLRRCLRRIVPVKLLEEEIEPDLIRFGERVCTDVWRLGQQCEESPPFVRQTNAWGKRVDDIVTCEAWKKQKVVAAEEGLISIAYERKQGEFSRLYQMVKLGLYAPASGLYSCPLAMTDGAAKSIEHGKLKDRLSGPFSHLTSRDPAQFWTSGQWMTEKGGGSDVGGGTDTIAVKESAGDHYQLYGYKWFSSATDSDMTLTLARIAEDRQGSKASGLSMFYLKTRNEDGSLNGIQVAKLKNKLGTRQLPTGELLLDGAKAQLVSPEGRGIPSISSMLLITRLHNVTSSVSGIRKILLLARDYATRRSAFGKELSRQPLHVQALSRMEAEARGCTALWVDLALKLGKADCEKISERDALILRIMMPVAKLYTAKQAVANISEGLECFGGQGYIEDTGLPAMLRDAQVLPIWEGTTNVLSLDMLRAVGKTDGKALKALSDAVGEIIAKASASSSAIQKSAAQIDGALKDVLEFAVSAQEDGKLEIAARDFAMSLAHVYVSALLLEQAVDSPELDTMTLQQWIFQRDLTPVVTNEKRGVYDVKDETMQKFVYDGYDRNNVYPSSYDR